MWSPYQPLPFLFSLFCLFFIFRPNCRLLYHTFETSMPSIKKRKNFQSKKFWCFLFLLDLQHDYLVSWTCPHCHLLVLLPKISAIWDWRSYFHLLSFYLVAKYGWKLITRPLLVSNSKEAPAYHLRIQSLLVVVFIYSISYPADLVNDKWFPATDMWTDKSYKKTFVWASHGWPWPDVLPWWVWTLSHPSDLRQHQRSKLDHRWMSLVVTNVSLKRPFMIYLYSNLIWSMAHPLLAVIFVTE